MSDDDIFRTVGKVIPWDQGEEKQVPTLTKEQVEKLIERDVKGKRRETEKEDPAIAATRLKKIAEMLAKRPEAQRMTQKRLRETAEIITITDALMVEIKIMAKRQFEEAKDIPTIFPRTLNDLKESWAGELARRESFRKKGIEFEFPPTLAGSKHLWDLKIKGSNETIEMKAQSWQGYRLDIDWRANFPATLIDKQVDTYAFAFVDFSSEQIALVGFIPRNEFLEIAFLKKKGEIVNGFSLESDTLMCEIRCLIPESEFHKPMSQVF